MGIGHKIPSDALPLEATTPEDVRRALADLDHRQQKIVAGMLAVMIKNPTRVSDREWIARQLKELTLLAGEFHADTPEAAVHAVHDSLSADADLLLKASFLLFQRVGLDLEPHVSEDAGGFNYEEAVLCSLEYLPPSSDSTLKAPSKTTRDLGQQPLARLMSERGLKPADLVAASTEQITHKMVTRAMKGRRLTPNTMGKVQRAWNSAAKSDLGQGDLFDYEP